MKVPESYLGKVGACVKCKQKMRITEKNTRPLPRLGAASSEDAAPQKRRIGELLVAARLISLEQLSEALQAQTKAGGKLGEILLSLGYLDVKTFASFLAKQPGIASIDLSNYEVPRELLTLMPPEFARKHDIFPIDKLGSLLTVAMMCPLDSRTIRELEAKTNLRIKALLCPMNDIRAAINRYYPEAEAPPLTIEQSASHIESALKLESVASLIRKLASLPALSETIRRIQETMQESDVSISDVVKVVRTDPAITAKILSVANSAAYGLPNRVDSITLAASLLGLTEVCGIATSLAVVDAMKDAHSDFWTDATRCAQVAMDVAKAGKKPVRTGVYAAALLHDIGRIALLQVNPRRYEKIPASLSGAALIASEQELLGIAHPEAGYELACNWGFPPELAEPIRFHHTFKYAEKAPAITAVVCVAATIADCQDSGALNEAYVDENCGEAMAFLGLDFQAVTVLAAAPSHEAEAV